MNIFQFCADQSFILLRQDGAGEDGRLGLLRSGRNGRRRRRFAADGPDSLQRRPVGRHGGRLAAFGGGNGAGQGVGRGRRNGRRRLRGSGFGRLASLMPLDNRFQTPPFRPIVLVSGLRRGWRRSGRANGSWRRRYKLRRLGNGRALHGRHNCGRGGRRGSGRDGRWPAQDGRLDRRSRSSAALGVGDGRIDNIWQRWV